MMTSPFRPERVLQVPDAPERKTSTVPSNTQPQCRILDFSSITVEKNEKDSKDSKDKDDDRDDGNKTTIHSSVYTD
jgi:hypothetical protein